MGDEIQTKPSSPGALQPRVLAEYALWVALTGASVGFFLWQVFHWSSLSRWFLENRGPAGAQAGILVWASAGAILLIGAVAIWYRVLGNSERLGLAVAWLRLGVPLFLVPALLLKSIWSEAPLLMMFVLVVGLAYLYWALDPIAPRWPAWWQRVPPRAWATAVALMVLGYFVYFSYYTVLNHYQLGTLAYDLGVFENTFLHTLHGNFLNNSEYGDISFFSRHFSPVFALWFPAYAILPGPETLLVVQSAFVALAAIPLFLLCRSMLRSDAAATLIVFCYLIHPANHGANFYDVHEIASLPVFILALFYFFEKRWNAAYFVTLVLALSVKEDIALLMIAVAIFFALEKRPKLALITAAICAVWYVASKQIIVASDGKAEMFDFYYSGMLRIPGQGAAGVVKTAVTNPLYALGVVATKERALFVLQLLVPLLGLSLLRVRNLWLVIYGFAITLLATRSQLHSIAFQYTWYLLPLLFVGLAYTLRDARSPDPQRAGWTRFVHSRAALVTLLVASLAVSWQYGAIFARDGFVGGFTEVGFTFDELERNRLTNLRSMVAMIPEDASVGASESLVPHVPVRNRRALWRHRSFLPDYIVIFNREIGSLEKRRVLHRYALVDQAYGISLLRKTE